MYICAEVSADGFCIDWAEFYGLLPPLSAAEALEISSMAFGLWAMCWAARQIVLALINR